MLKERNKAMGALILRSLGFLVGAAGIILHYMADNVADSAFMVRHKLAYYTIQTNLLTVALFGFLAVKTLVDWKRRGRLTVARISPGLHLASACYITVTMLGFWLLLVPATGAPADPFLFFNTLLLHTVTPLLSVLDQLLYGDHGKVSYRAAFSWLIYPGVYLIFVMLYSQTITTPYYSFRMGERTVELMYPYPFLDPQLLGWPGVAAAAAGLAAGFLLLSLGAIGLDRLLGRRAQLDIPGEKA